MGINKVSDEVSYDFSRRMFMFIHPKNNNVAQHYLLSQKEKDKISSISHTLISKTSKNKYVIVMI